MNNELVSIITPVYNAERFLKETLDSVRNQSYQNWEMILVDDCSKDSSEKIIKEYISLDNRIKYIKLETNSGAAVSRNIAIKKSKGRYIAFLDSDDIWKENKLRKQISFMKKNNIGFSFSMYDVITESGEKINRVIKVPKVIDYKEYLKNTIIGCLTVVIDREICGDFEMVNIRKNQDMATWLQILKKGYKAYGIDECLATYRLVDGSISNNKLKAAKSVWKTYREVEKLNALISGYYFLGYSFNAIKKRVFN
ncbi:glycosyltransferase [Clostridium perfringens]|uniref:glycosyltransferase family 2 protein n=1 Tax=Clostridium perfringens TaxID=1502 RepID=UPI00016BC6DF|nr:glycosyltransferase family 2 protein [Clostridium perfringens]EDT78822.1 putative teichuronic acid biosynthesis glycosyltransferase TuaG [Clostridium perfringens NCTC 8239]ELC8383141.1 glycosyltransferase family 2 protein [Clostridium perfringens]MCX0359285.1 glycosyltransferase [Clostridium perfringens]MCX0420466.1 glycosyltransferase [Clostridium perfringens]MDK0589006.1 glycosyltransferase family 2 protein [Clostridium perfringens]